MQELPRGLRYFTPKAMQQRPENVKKIWHVHVHVVTAVRAIRKGKIFYLKVD